MTRPPAPWPIGGAIRRWIPRNSREQAAVGGPLSQAERGGFEPPSEITPTAGFRNRSIQPLWHLSGVGPSVALHPRAARRPERAAESALRISSGSLIRPGPTWRHACQPLPGPTIRYPFSVSVLRFR